MYFYFFWLLNFTFKNNMPPPKKRKNFPRNEKNDRILQNNKKSLLEQILE